MSLKFMCPNCGAEIILKYVGHRETAKCCTCRATVTVPMDAAEDETWISRFPLRPAPLDFTGAAETTEQGNSMPKKPLDKVDKVVRGGYIGGVLGIPGFIIGTAIAWIVVRFKLS